MCNLDSAAVFKSLEKDDIENVQRFIREELYTILQEKSKENNSAYDDKHNSIFFGLYSAMHERFQFTIGDKKKLNVTIEHVKQTVGSEENYSHFDVTNKRVKGFMKSWNKTFASTPAGEFFGDISINATSVSNKRNVDDLKQILFTKAKTHLESYEKLERTREFEESSITVTVEGDKYKGTVRCLFCEDDPVCVSYQVYGKSGSWSLSNLIRHMKIHHSASNLVAADHCRKRTTNQKMREAILMKQPKLDADQKGPVAHDITYSISNARLDEVVKLNNSVLTMKIEPLVGPHVGPCVGPHGTFNSGSKNETVFDELEDNVYLQSATQIIKLKNACILNNEKIIEFYSEINLSENSTNNEVKCCQIRGDGDCLFASVAHQLFYMKIDSIQHKECTQKLRQEVVDHVRLNLNRFIHCLKGRVFDETDKHINGKRKKARTEEERKVYAEELTKQCNLFVKNKLANGIWGGAESLHALSELYKINIVIINHNGSSNMIKRFDSSFDRTILLTYRNGNHYDSAVVMNDHTILHHARTLVASDIKSMNTNPEYFIDSDT